MTWGRAAPRWVNWNETLVSRWGSHGGRHHNITSHHHGIPIEGLGDGIGTHWWMKLP